MNDTQQIVYRNTYLEMPEILSNTFLEKTVGISVIGLKLLKITLLGIAPFRETITRKNISKTAIVAKCDCGFYCKFNFKGLTAADSLPACGRCNAELEEFIEHYASENNITLSKQQAWEKLGYSINPRTHSLIFWYLLNKGNHHQLRLGANFTPMTADTLAAYNIPKYTYLSRACKLAPIQQDPENPYIAYQCLCGAFCYFKVSMLQSFEPLGMCSVCTDELRYSFCDTSIHPFIKQLRFKHLWRHLIEKYGYPYVEFRYVWEEYFKVRKLVRKEGIELHFSDYFHDYYQQHVLDKE